MRALWRDVEAEYHGSHYSVESSWSWPKPMQADGPSVHLGSRASLENFAAIARWGHGWLPIEGYGSVIEHLPRLKDAFAAADRAEPPVVSVYSSSGVQALMEQYRRAGVDRVVLALPPGDERMVLQALDAATVHLSALR